MENIYIIINSEYFANDLVMRSQLTIVDSLRTGNDVGEEEKRKFSWLREDEIHERARRQA